MTEQPSTSLLRIHLVAGARPNFMKIAPLYHALCAVPWAAPLIVHTDQHYDDNMSGTFLRDLGLPKPNYSLGVGSGLHGEQTARVMIAYEKICLEARPDLIVVVGDVNSMLGAALVGVKLHIPVAHLEAGLRSFDRTMPEEINRVAADAIVDLLWTPSADADENLLHEGIPASRIERVGNIMIDSFEMLRPSITATRMHETLNLAAASYGLITLHRPNNVDSPERLAEIARTLCRLSALSPLVCPVHPRTRKNLQQFGLWDQLQAVANIRLLDPLPYKEFMALLLHCRFALTDSGGIQEETTYLGIPCLTLRESTERPITVTLGTNLLTRLDLLEQQVSDIISGRGKQGRVPELWDGRTRGRIVDSIRRRFAISA